MIITILAVIAGSNKELTVLLVTHSALLVKQMHGGRGMSRGIEQLGDLPLVIRELSTTRKAVGVYANVRHVDLEAGVTNTHG